MPERQIKVIPALSRAERTRKTTNRPIRVASQADLRTELVEGKAKAMVIPQAQAPVKIAATAPVEVKKLHVAGYCRVSTGTTQQETSIVAQREHYEEYIKSHPDWEFAGIYWEAAVSGTKKENRPELQRLIAACKAGSVDLILTKSISRFARNTTDCLEMVRTLTALGVNILFEKENIHTGTMESEFLLTLFSTFAEEESKSISANELWTKHKQFENGTFRYSTAPFGYNLVDGTFEVNPERAPIVREIFDAVLAGKGTPTIAKELNARGIPTGTKRNDGSPGVWTAYMIGGMIKNVAYIGDVLNQKTFFDHFHLKYNYGEKKQYYNEGHHDAIVDKDTFERANAAIRQRGAEKGNHPCEDRQLRNNPHSNRYAFSGKLKCACCGGTMKRVTQKTAQGKKYHWVCSDHVVDKSVCSMKREREENIKNAFATMLNKLLYAKDIIFETYISRLRQEEAKENAAALEVLNEELNQILDEKRRLTLLISKGCGEPVSFRQKLIELEARENTLRYDISQKSGDSMTFRAVSDARDALGNWKKGGDLDSLFTEIVESAKVETGKCVIFNLKCGLKLTESLKEA